MCQAEDGTILKMGGGNELIRLNEISGLNLFMPAHYHVLKVINRIFRNFIDKFNFKVISK